MAKRLTQLTSSTPIESPTKKRKSVAFIDHTLTEATPIRPLTLSTFEPGEDEEIERHKRRSIANMQEKLNNTEHYSKDVIMPHLEICMKLYANNKIDSKNIWAVKIIDYMSAMVRDNLFETDTLKMATNTMEVGSKVFGLRVDCVHAQTLQLASNMARNTEVENEEDEVADENAPADAGNPEKQSKPKRVKKHRLLDGDEPSIVKDVSTLFAPIQQLPIIDFQLDHGAMKTYSKYLTTSVIMNYDGRFMFMSNERYFKTDEDLKDYDETILDEPVPYDEDFDIDDIDIENFKLCPAFDNFWVTDTDDATKEDPVPEEIFYDQDGAMIAELDGSIYDPFQENNIQDEDENEEENMAQIGPLNTENIVSVIPEDSVYPYLYDTVNNNPNIIIDLWAGPSHWKVKWIKQRPAIFTGTIQQNKEQKKRLKKQEPVEVIFDENEEITTSVIRKKIPRTKKTKKRNYYLPVQYITDSMKPMESFRNRYILPVEAMRKALPRVNDVQDLPVDYNYENPNDSQFCINSEDDGPLDNDGPNNLMHDENNEDLMDTSGIDLPEICPKSNIGYAKSAKKMNMKKLKCAVWDYLANTKTYLQDTPDTQVQEMVGEKHFRVLYTTLPKKINQSMQEALSSPLAFAALLHLANENNLHLIGVVAMNDIIIKQNQ